MRNRNEYWREDYHDNSTTVLSTVLAVIVVILVMVALADLLQSINQLPIWLSALT